jgi:hypothetical protein
VPSSFLAHGEQGSGWAFYPSMRPRMHICTHYIKSSILGKEKYKGDAPLQKTFCKVFMIKRRFHTDSVQMGRKQSEWSPSIPIPAMNERKNMTLQVCSDRYLLRI